MCTSSDTLQQDLRCRAARTQRCHDAVSRLPPEKLAVLQLAGVEVAPGSLHEWLRLAHAAACFLIGADYSVPDASTELPCSLSPTDGQLPSQPAAALDPTDGHAVVPSPRSRSPPQIADRLDVGTSLTGSATTSWHVLTVAGAARPPVSVLAIKRWILVQKALVEEGRLTHAQLRYLAVLGAPVACKSLCKRITPPAPLRVPFVAI